MKMKKSKHLKRISFFALFVFFLSAGNLFCENAALIANRQTAIRCLKLAKSYISQNIWDAVSSKIEMGLAYDDSISDLWYLDAVVKTHNGATRSEIRPLIERSLAQGNWIDYNRDNARVLYADLLCDTGLHEQALSVLDEEPFLFSADAEFIRIKVFYLQKTSDSLEKARDKIDAARRVYPSDARFARLFFRNEFALLKEGERPSPDVQRMADAFILLVPKYADADAELELYAALFSDGEKKIRLLKAYHAKELTHPLYAEASLKAGLMTQKEAVEYFVEWADVSISLEWLKSFAVLITEDEPVEFLREYLNSYEGLLTVDTDGDLEPNLFVDYYRGRPQNIQWDRNNDGINEWTAVCDFGVPTAVCIPADEITVNYGSFPYITKLSHKNSNGRNVTFSFADEQFEWTPFSVSAELTLRDALRMDFFLPQINFSAEELDFKTSAKFAFSYEIDSDEYAGAIISFSLLNGIPQSAVYSLNGVQYAQAFFEDGRPLFRAVDRDGDGIFETTETYALDEDGKIEMSAEDSSLLMTSLYGYPMERNGLYIKMIQIDQNGDTKPDFTEEYLAGNGKITSWDSDNDGHWDTRYVRYPKKADEGLIEDSMFYLMPGRVLTAVTCVDGEPVKVVSNEIEYGVTKGEISDFYWVGNAGSMAEEEAVASSLDKMNRQGECLVVEVENSRVLSIKVADFMFGRLIPQEAQDSLEDLQESQTEKKSEN